MAKLASCQWMSTFVKVQKFAKRAGLRNFGERVPSGTFNDRVDRHGPMAHVEGGTLTGGVCFGQAGAIDAGRAARDLFPCDDQGRFNNVASDTFHRCSLLMEAVYPLPAGPLCVRGPDGRVLEEVQRVFG